MALGRSQVQQGFDDPRVLLGDRLREGSLYRLLADHGQVMFPDGYFAGLYTESAKGRPTVPARVVATVLRVGRRNVIVQADVIDVGDGRKLVATATLSYARLDAR